MPDVSNLSQRQVRGGRQTTLCLLVAIFCMMGSAVCVWGGLDRMFDKINDSRCRSVLVLFGELHKTLLRKPT